MRRTITAAACVFLLFTLGVPAYTIGLAAAQVVVVAVLGLVWWPRRRVRRTVWGSVEDDREREVWTYAFGSKDRLSHEITHIKFGVTAQPWGLREWQIEHEEGQVPRTHTVVALAYGPGGEARERHFHERLAVYRYPSSEWFQITADTVAAVRELERPTAEGKVFLRRYR